MGFSEAVRTVLNKYATFEGRARRSEYWYFTLLSVILSIAAQVIGGGGRNGGLITLLLLGVLCLVSLALLIPGIAVSVRRLHDTGRSGWFLLIALIPLVGGILLLVWMCSRGTEGPNRFGADPIPAV
ncbi:MAG: DUF805 domain-containing protein [Burkholderia sp.]|jgi:uncharacterized membrane protein YhaH (DUF805 family)|uniref:DUF805 domain-containing protein n=2 Tax=Burkholderiaceae TaxID=119060 RepID=UPI00158AEB42|nr:MULTISPECIES: DUF805 domain-containing protein [Burkholderia]MCA3778455.1 DUF805 domain-containing protein [Burkholderia sp.]MCA3795971.1 DUF805 domain-containing protein [Burkholderia sp.]MCA3803474.1 DUF805 domain-containing protein [Burkholderia sp.]MCA3808937.1 DUF805 domain-containing protein [Burkholderia sp.]MCA3814580.1 DUF805 domain-containing protein [Burkholderia sp.]